MLRLRLLITLVFCFVIFQNIFAQKKSYIIDNDYFESNPLSDSILKSKISINSDNYYNSNHITKKLAYLIYNKTTLTDNLDQSYLSAKKLNRTTFNQKNRIQFVIHIKNGLYYDLEIGNHNQMFSSYSSDLFGLMAFGNGKFPNKKLTFDPTNITVLNQSYLKYGLIKQKNDITIGMNMAINVLNKYQNINISKGSVFTEQNGEYLDLELNYNYTQLDSTSKPFGLGLGAFYCQKFKNKSFISLKLDDFGMFFLNNNVKSFQKDTAFRFEGLDFQNFKKLFDKNAIENETDSLIHSIKNEKYEKMRISNLANVKLTYFKKIKYNLGYGSQLSYVFTKNSRLLCNHVLWYKIPHLPLQTYTELALGGFGSWDLNVTLNVNIKKFNLFAKVYALEAIIAPKTQSGFGVHAGVSLRL